MAKEHATIAEALFHQARNAEALAHFGEAVRLAPEQPGYHYGLAMSAWRLSQLHLAGHHLREVIRLAPLDPKGHKAISQWYLETADTERAMLHSARALEMDPNNPEVIVARAFVLEGTGVPRAAWELIEPLVHTGYRSTRLGLLYARVAPPERRTEALAIVLRQLESAATKPSEQVPLHFAAAALLDRMGRYDEAFSHARQANQSSLRPYDPAQISRQVDAQIDYFTPTKFQSLSRASHRSRRPVFIVGMLRSGTSLVEQILASHPNVYGAGELEAMGRIATAAAGSDWAKGISYPRCLDALSVPQANAMAEAYLSALPAGSAAATYVTDKMPHNFLYLGLNPLLFPDCHVIHCTRNPLDICISSYMTYFANGHDFTRDFVRLGHFYRDYRRLMDHWKRTVQLPMLEVKYEDVVRDLEGETRRLLEALDLSWDESCLNFHQNTRPVATASREQVKQPIYASSVGRWRRYEAHLSGLIEFLKASDLLENW